MTKNRLAYLAAVAALGFTLASCTGGGEEPPATDSDSTSETGRTGGGDATTETGDDGSETEDAATAGAECLLGTWAMTPEAMEDQVDAQVGGEAEVNVKGTSTISFDGETSTTSVDNSSTFAITVEGGTMEGASLTQGTIVMGYTADDATITYTDVVSAEGTISTTVGGSHQELTMADTAAAMSGETLTYSCTDTELTLTSTIPGLDVELEQTFARS